MKCKLPKSYMSLPKHEKDIINRNTLKNEAEQTEYLRAEIDRIFGKDGYPSEYIDMLEEM